MAIEIWDYVLGYNGKYSVSTFGNVRNNNTGKILKPCKDCKGYLSVKLYDDNTKPKIHKIHRLVAITFIPNPSNLPQVNHKDEVKINNYVDNLEWCDNIYNCNYGNHNKKLPTSVAQYDCNKNYIRRSDSMSDASKPLNICLSSIHRCCKHHRPTAGGFIWEYIIKKGEHVYEC